MQDRTSNSSARQRSRRLGDLAPPRGEPAPAYRHAERRLGVLGTVAVPAVEPPHERESRRQAPEPVVVTVASPVPVWTPTRSDYLRSPGEFLRPVANDTGVAARPLTA